ncbi:MAG: aryl-sulfate sulfotransferase [Candidatus Kapabacteria bacterium]|nr:aryl-sulfate sulfotransferase [Candidatus Kapabacteria bacterium]
MKHFSLIFISLILINGYLFADDVFPAVYLHVQEDPSPGYFFVSPFGNSTASLIDNGAHHIYDKATSFNDAGTNNVLWDFKIHPNNRITFFSRAAVFEINKNYDVIDSFVTQNYPLDFHEFIFLSNGNALLLGQDNRIVDMSQLVDGGRVGTKVYEFVLQEIDANKNVVWQWFSYDHIPITDATTDNDLTNSEILPIHINAFCEDYDGNIIISCRHLDELIKINKGNGNVIWRMGGSASKNNQFTFVNDTNNGFVGFSHQHDIRRLPNGHYLLFDNGNLKPNPYSRAVEYTFDQVNKIVTKVWEYRLHDSDHAGAMGSAQRLENGSTVICAGKKVFEVTQNGTVSSNFELSSPANLPYRVYKFVIFSDAVAKDITGNGSYLFNQDTSVTNLRLNLTSVTGNGKLTVEKHFYPAFDTQYSGPGPCLILPYRWVITKNGISSISGKIRIKISDLPEVTNPYVLDLYKREKDGYGYFTKLQNFQYYSATQEIEADFSGFGEIIIGTDTVLKAILTNPANNSGSHLLSGYVYWRPMYGTDNFNVQIAADQSFSNLLYDRVIRDSSCFYYTGFDYNKKYYWRVRYSSPCGNSDWSTPNNFTTKLFYALPNTPANGARAQSTAGTISWGAVDGATKYRFQLSSDLQFKSLITDKSNISTSSMTYTDLVFNQTYFWRVIASSSTNTGDWSPAYSFTVILGTPIQNYPANNTPALKPNDTLSWDVVPGAERYRLQISEDFDFDTIKVDESGITKNSFTLTTLEFNKMYYWRLKASNSSGKSDWSPVWNFTTIIDHPTLKSPIDNSSDLPINCSFSWIESLGAITHRLQISTKPDFSTLFFQDTVLTTNFKTVNNFQFNTVYYWRVASKNKVCISNWSDTWTFTTVPKNILLKPVLTDPANNNSGIKTDPELTWKAVTDANKYRLQYSDNNSFQKVILDTIINNSTSFKIGGLKNNTWYFWHIMAENDLSSSPWSETGSFLTALTTPKLINPSKDTVYSVNGNLFSWSRSDSAKDYHIQVGEDPLFDVLAIDDRSPNVYYKFSDLSNDRTYYWHVQALNFINNSLWTATQKFKTEKIISVEDEINSFKLNIFPNPFSSQLNFELNLSYNSLVELKIYDMLGNEQAEVFKSSYLNHGTYSYKIKPDFPLTGLYIWKLKINSLVYSGIIINLN